MNIAIYDTSIASPNVGDQIIMDAHKLHIAIIEVLIAVGGASILIHGLRGL